MEFMSLSWEELHRAVYGLSEKIKEACPDCSLLVAMARGGMTPAHMLSDFLKLPVATFTLSSYRDMQQQNLTEITYQVGGQLKGKKILLVDDISDTGKTFVKGIEHIKNMGGVEIKTAALFAKPWTQYLPDYYELKTDKWIVFPYEVRETIESVSRIMEKEGKKNDEIRRKLKEIKIPERYIERYLPGQYDVA